jgi:hypothetical protein
MATDYSKLSDEELYRRIEELTAPQPQQPSSGVGSAARAALGGASSGATSLLGFIPEVVSIPAQLSGRGAPTIPGTDISLGGSPMSAMRRAFEVPDEPRSGVEQGIYRFAEGFTPAAAMALPSYAAGPVIGTAATLGSGLLGGFSNLAAKGIFPESPLMQTAVNLLPAGIAGAASRIRSNVPQTSRPSVSEDTGIPMTGGQRAGSESLIRQESAVAKTEAGAPIFQRFGLTQANTAEDFASKIQEFSANPNLTATQINEGVIGAVNFQNSRIVNKFRAQNRVNFNAAEKVAGKERIFGTDNLNTALDNQIAYYSSEQMPADLRAVAGTLKDLKSRMSIQEQPSLILGPDGRPAVVAPAQAQKLTVAELQKNLESWGKAAKTGEFAMPGGTDNVFRGITPGTVKNISRQVLKGFRDDLDAAVRSNVKGARELTKARDDFRTGLQDLDAYAETPLIKKFMKDNPTAIDPTETVNYLTQASPTERVVMLNLLDANRPDIVSSLRNKTMQQVLEDSKGDTGALLTQLKRITNQNSEAGSLGLNDFLFKTPAEKAKVKVLVRDLESINKKPVGTAESMRAQVQGITSEASAVGGGWTVGKAVSTIQDSMNMLSGSANSAEKLAWMMTNPDGQSVLRYLASQKTSNKPLPKTYADTLNFVAKNFAIPAASNRPQELGINPLESLTDEELEQRIQQLQGQQ